MKFRLNPKNRRRLIIAASAVGVVALLLFLLPIGLRWGAAKWLTDQGVVTRIEDIDLNLFTGTLVITNAHGENDRGNGFSIEHALVNLRYWPLFSKQIYLSDLELRNSRVDVLLGKDGALNVAGLSLPASEAEQPPPEDDSTPWGFGLDRAAIGHVTLHYQQPGFDREITLSSSSTSDVATWQPDRAIPLDVDLSIDKSQIKLQGKVKPFGDQITGDIKLGIKDFSLDLVAPLAKQAGIERLAGRINSDLQIALDYRAQNGLKLGVDGSAALARATVGMPDLNINNADIKWKGKIDAKLLQRDGGADAVNTNGHLSLGKLDVGLPRTLAFNQGNTDWQGQINAELGTPLTVLADGALTMDATHLDLFAPPAQAATEPAKTQQSPEPQSADNSADTATPDAPANAAAPGPQETQPEAAANADADGQNTAPESNQENSNTKDAKQKPGDTPEPDTQTEIATRDDAGDEAAASAAPTHTPQAAKTLTLDQDSIAWKGKINLALAELGPKLNADGQLTTANTHLLLPADNTDIKQGALDWQGSIEMTPGEQGPSIKTKGKLAATGADLALPASGIAVAQQALNWEGSLDYAPGEPALIHASGGLTADGLNLDLAPQAMGVTGGHFGWSGDLALDPDVEGMPADTELPVKLTGKLDGADVVVTDTAQSKILAKVDKFTLADVALTGLDDIRSESITVNGLNALERAKNAPRLDEYPYIASIQDLSIDKLAFTGQSRLALADIDISGLGALLYRDKAGAVEASQWFAKADTAEAADTTPPQTPSASEDNGPGFQIALNHALIHDSQLAIDDRGVSPAFETQLSSLRIAMADLDSAKPAQGSALNISSALGRYGSIEADGQIKPFLEPPSANLTGKINAINLAPISGYTAQAIDRRIDQGTFSADLKLDMDRGELDANAKLTLTKLRIGGAQSETGEVKKKLGLPLNKILGLLRDRDGNITLNLPVGGDIENPEFSVLGIVRKAIFKSLQAAVLLVYSPLGIIKAGAGLLNLATALRPDPVLFDPGKTALDDTDETYLNKTADLLNKRPKVEMIVCGHAVPSDRTALALPDPDAAVAEGETAPTPEQLSDARDKLLELAGMRSSLVGDYLVSKGIEPQRLVLCNPALGEADKELPRTTLSF